MAKTAFITHPSCQLHEMGEHHFEVPGRLSVIEDALIAQRLADFLVYRDAPAIDFPLIASVHSQQHIDWLVKHAEKTQDYFAIDDDTVINPHTLTAARHAAGAGIIAIDGIFNQSFDNAFCAVRPPGHHAEHDRSMGFCIFNNIAIAAHYAMQRFNVERIAIVDFDVHHGNGTEDIFGSNNNILFCSSYQDRLYPEKIDPHAHENCLHSPLPPGTTSRVFRDCYESTIFPAIDAFKPDLILISAGFDGHKDDPLADWMLVDADYGWVTRRLKAMAEQHCEGRILSFMEGGYNLSALSICVVAHLKALMDV